MERKTFKTTLERRGVNKSFLGGVYVWHIFLSEESGTRDDDDVNDDDDWCGDVFGDEEEDEKELPPTRVRSLSLSLELAPTDCDVFLCRDDGLGGLLLWVHSFFLRRCVFSNIVTRRANTSAL